ncbi:SH3 and multiple ankyrin repeat domains protein 1-like [Amphibalanus amphitrite]|uniref:SH3 and multiple ankyrin repeat domains protein 1-like n=1 Tax=Amphibalanus amphitrite TaxID=1232801 RepID=UPI001C929373|nr:SH3 and multiple ankyrin repeat domains protein 1-like [Amphibalanus amphitrite]
MKKVLSRLAKVGRSSSHAAAEPAERDPQADTPGGTPEEQTERPAAYDLVGRERTLSGLQRAVWDGDVARVRSLTAKSTAGVQARDREGRSLLHLAAARGHREMVELLLERRLPVDAEDGDGNTPLLKAAEADSAASVRLLLERGASASHCNHHQQNGLHVSSRRGAEPVLQALLQHGANVDQVDKDGHTPLHLSVLHAHPELAAALLLHGAALAPADRDGRTALHLAAGRGLSELVAQLLEGGAEAELRDDEGLTAGELAVREGFPHIQSQIRRLSRRHRSLSQMFSVEDLGVDGPPPAETAKVQRLGSTSSAGVPTPRVASSLSSAGVPTPRLASSLSSAREAAPRLASSLSSAGEPEPGPGRPDPAATPAAPISVGSDSWSDDDELNFAPPPRKPSIPLPACFLAGTSPLPTDRAGDHGGVELASGQPHYSDISGVKRLSSDSGGGGDGGPAGDSGAGPRDQRRTSCWSSGSESESPKRTGRSSPRARPSSERGAEGQREDVERADGTENSCSEPAVSPVKRPDPRPERDDSWGDVSPIPFVTAAGDDSGPKPSAVETGAGDAPQSVGRAASDPPEVDLSDGEDSWGDDSPVLPRPWSSGPPRLNSDPVPEPGVERADPAPEREAEQTDSVSEDSWGDSDGSPILPGSPSDRGPSRRTSGVRPTSRDGPADGGTGPVRETSAVSVLEDGRAPIGRRPTKNIPQIQRPSETADDGDQEEEEDLSSWGDVSPVLPRSPAVPRRESLAGTADHRASDPPLAPAAVREPPAPPQPAARVERQSSPVAPEDSWGDVSPVLPRSRPARLATPPQLGRSPADHTATAADDEDSRGVQKSASDDNQPGAEDSWGDVSPILSRRSVPATAAAKQTAEEDSWGDTSLPSELAAVSRGAAAERGDTEHMEAGGGTETGTQPPEQPSDEESWGDESLPAMGRSDSEGVPSERRTLQRSQNEISGSLSRKGSREPISGNVSAAAKVSEDSSWSDHSSSLGDKVTCKSGDGQDFKRRQSSETHGESRVKTSESAAGLRRDSFVSKRQKSMSSESSAPLVEGTHGDAPVRSLSPVAPPRRLPGLTLDTTSSEVPAQAEPARRARLSSWCDDPVPPAGPAAPTPASAAPTAEDSGSWDDSSSAGDDGGNSARLVASPPAEREGPAPSEPSSHLKTSADPESAHQPQSSVPTAALPLEPDYDTWDSSVAESAASPRPEPGGTEDGAGTGPQRPVRRRSVTLLSPPRSRETSASETADATHTQCSTSLAGTLGRDGTLQGTDELWEGNATLRADGTIGGGSSPRDGGPTDPSPPPVEPPPLQLASPDRPPRLGQRRVSVSLPLSADRALPVTGERRRRGSVTSVSSTSSVSSLKSVGRTLREWRQTLLAPLRSRRRRRSLELPVRRHSIAIDSFLTEQAELTADDQVEDMYREEEAPRRAVSRHRSLVSPTADQRGSDG